MDIGPSGGGLLLGSGGICPGCCGVVGALNWSWLLLGIAAVGSGWLGCCSWCCWGLALVLAAVGIAAVGSGWYWLGCWLNRNGI